MNYATYKHNRDLNISHQTLCDVFGEVRCELWREQYREDTRKWLASPRVTEVCNRLREERMRGGE